MSNYQASIDRYAGHSNSYVPLGERTDCPVDANSPGGLYCPVEEQHVTEDVDAAYIMFKFGGDDTKMGQRQRQGQHRCAMGDDRRHRRRWRAVPDLHSIRSVGAGAWPAACSDSSERSHAGGGHRVHERGDVTAVRRRQPRQRAAQPERALRPHRRAILAIRRVACALAPGHGSVQELHRHFAGPAGLRRRLGDLRRTELHRRCAHVHAAIHGERGQSGA